MDSLLAAARECVRQFVDIHPELRLSDEVPIQSVTNKPFLWEMLYHALYIPEGQPASAREVVRLPGWPATQRAGGVCGTVGSWRTTSKWLLRAARRSR